eukprot:TRINITY_DN10075_c1_g3_i1.p1 TRINITY_DN10075_c1_g3~~TRINITY_DN10075_c1_g3_i1.p1  ORF type:complete len:537 (+),score=79.20 TRINITY_DN10075_c1_g3_i1:77-1687(+)
MIHYENTNWRAYFSLKGSVLQKALPWALFYSIASAGISLLLHGWQGLSGNDNYVGSEEFEKLRNMDFSGRLRDFTFILGFFITFRAQKAYSRWWEGGTLLSQLRGEWFNAFSSLLAFSNPDPKLAEQVQEFQHALASMVSLLYANALGQVSQMEDEHFELINIEGFDADAIEFLHCSPDGCEVVLQWIQRAIVLANSHDVIKIAPPLLARVYNQLGSGIVRLNNARKIHEYPIPFPIAQMVWFQLILHGLLTAFVSATLANSLVLTCFCTFLVCQTIWTIHFIAIELEQPYGDDLNDLPLKEMMYNLNESMCNLLQPQALVPPKFSFNKDMGIQLTKEAIKLREGIKHRKSMMMHAKSMEEERSGTFGKLRKTVVKQRRNSQGPHGPGVVQIRPHRFSVIQDEEHTSQSEPQQGISAIASTASWQSPPDAGSAFEGSAMEGSAFDTNYDDSDQYASASSEKYRDDAASASAFGDYASPSIKTTATSGHETRSAPGRDLPRYESESPAGGNDEQSHTTAFAAAESNGQGQRTNLQLI